MKLWCPGYTSPIGTFDMQFVRHDHELNYLRNLRKLMAQVADFQRMSDFNLICFKRPYCRLCLVYVTSDWWRELDFEGLHRRGLQHLRFMGWHNFKVFALPHHDRDALNASVPESRRSYDSQKAIGVGNPPILSYLSGFVLPVD